MPPPDWLSWELWARYSQVLYHFALILAGLIGIPLLYIRTRAAHRQAKTAEQGHITDRFTAAVEQLGSDKMAVRLGAVYALERISRDSRRDHWTIMETLTAYVREHAPWPPGPDRPPQVEQQPRRPGGVEPPEPQIRPETDIQAILTVLGRRDEQARKQDETAKQYLDLAGTDLRGARLKGAHVHLEGANLRGAHLEGAVLEEAHLEGAGLDGAHFERANLREAHLEDADLRRAHLDRADLQGAHLERADLRSADLRRADLRGGAHLAGANLEGATLWGRAGPGGPAVRLYGTDLARAVGLTQEQLEWAWGDERTTLPKGIPRPFHWPSATPDEPDA